jgi:hypothetical protein
MKLGLPAFCTAFLLLTACSPQQDDKKPEGTGLDSRIVDNIAVPDTEPEPTNNSIEAASDGGGGDFAWGEGNASGPSASKPGPKSIIDDGKGIPAAIRGRWGLVPADCTSKLGDAKGLLEISATKLTFYESRGLLKSIKDRKPDRLRATFSFEGEGQSWMQDMLMITRDGGKTMIRTEFGEDAMPQPLTYKRCKE